jgi:hypothetical protein
VSRPCTTLVPSSVASDVAPAVTSLKRAAIEDPAWRR